MKIEIGKNLSETILIGICIIGLIIIILFLMTPVNVHADTCFSEEQVINFSNKEIETIRHIYNFESFDSYEKAFIYANRKGLENNIIKEQNQNLWRVFSNLPTDICINYEEIK